MKNDTPTAASTSAAPASASERVERPEPGLARGRWEAPAWVFWAIVALAIGACLGWGALAYRRSLHGGRPWWRPLGGGRPR